MVVSFRDISIDDLHHVGVKPEDINDGFAVTARAYFKFLRDNNLETKIRHLIGSINFDHESSLAQVSYHIKNLISKSRIPESIVYKIIGHYVDLGASRVWVRTSLISGDPNHKKVLIEKMTSVDGDAVLLDTVRSFWSHVFEPAYIIHRYKNGMDQLKTGVAVIVHKA